MLVVTPRRLAAPLIALILLVPAGLHAQRGPRGRHARPEREQAVNTLQQGFTAQSAFLRRYASDDQFAAAVDDATDRGDFNTAAALFSQATGLPEAW